MSPKSSAHYQREFRKRLREQGLVKKEVWILPEHASALSAIEKTLRQGGAVGQVPQLRQELRQERREEMTSLSPGSLNTPQNAETIRWTTTTLYEAVRREPLFTEGHAAISLVDGVEPSIAVEMHDYGELPLFVSVFGEQIIVDAVLWPASAVNDPVAFNDTVLRTHKFFPLSTISLDTLANGEAYYQMFGAISAASRVASVVHEIDTLARNVIQAVEAYRDYLTQEI